MKSETSYSLYDFLLSKTNGNFNKHAVRKAFQDLGRENNLLSFRPNSEEHALVSVDECSKPEGERLLLAASSTLALPRILYVKPNTSLVVNEDSICLYEVSDNRKKDYWLADGTGMFVKQMSVPIQSFSLVREPRIPAREKRLYLIQRYFEKAREQLDIPQSTNTEVYICLGSPTREALWAEWKRIWPDSFKSYQRNDFNHPPLQGIEIQRGTGVGRKIVKIKIHI